MEARYAIHATGGGEARQGDGPGDHSRDGREFLVTAPVWAPHEAPEDEGRGGVATYTRPAIAQRVKVASPVVAGPTPVSPSGG